MLREITLGGWRQFERQACAHGREITALLRELLRKRVPFDSASLPGIGDGRGGPSVLISPWRSRSKGCVVRTDDIRGGTSSVFSPFE